MRIRNNAPKKVKPPEYDIDGNDLDHITQLRATAQNRYMPMPKRAACMDCLPEHYQVKLPADVDLARREYKAFLDG
jgi:hypothetical protein